MPKGLNTSGPLNNQGFWGKLGNVGLRIGATGFGNTLLGPLGGMGVNLAWNKYFGNSLSNFHPSGVGVSMANNPFFGSATNPTLPNLGLGNGLSSPIFGGFNMNNLNLPLTNTTNFQNMFGGIVPPSVNLNSLPVNINKLPGFNWMNLNPTAPAKPPGATSTTPGFNPAALNFDPDHSVWGGGMLNNFSNMQTVADPLNNPLLGDGA